MKHVRDLKLEYKVVEVFYNESDSNTETELFIFTDVRDAVHTCREFVSENTCGNTDYVVQVDWS